MRKKTNFADPLDIPELAVEELRTALKEYWSFHKETGKIFEISKHSKQSKPVGSTPQDKQSLQRSLEK
jgi:hypothetical protein